MKAVIMIEILNGAISWSLTKKSVVDRRMAFC